MIELELAEGLVEIEIEVSEPQRESAIQKDSASPQRPKQPAPSTTEASDEEYEDGFDDDAENN